MIRKPVALVGSALQIEAPLPRTVEGIEQIEQQLRTVDPACTGRPGPGPAGFTLVFEGREFVSHTGILTVPLRG